MKTYEFSPLNVTKLSVRGLYSLIKTTVNIGKPVVSYCGPIATAALVNLESVSAQMVVVLNTIIKSVYTSELRELEAEREVILNEIKRSISIGILSNNNENKRAAVALQLFLSSFWSGNGEPLDTETSTLLHLDNQYNQQPNFQKAAKLLEIDSLFISLASTNIAFNTKFSKCALEQAERSELALSLKPAAISVYKQFVTAIEQVANHNPNDTVIAIFYQLDELRKFLYVQGDDSTVKSEIAVSVASAN